MVTINNISHWLLDYRFNYSTKLSVDTEAYIDPSQTSMMEPVCNFYIKALSYIKIVYIFEKSSKIFLHIPVLVLTTPL